MEIALANSQAEPGPLVRLNVNLNQETAAALQQIKERRGTNITETVRRAISLMKYVSDEEKEGRELRVVSAKGRVIRNLTIL